MCNDKEKAPVLEFLGWVLLLSLFSEIILLLLEPYSISYMTDGTLTVGYIVYGSLAFSSPHPTP